MFENVWHILQCCIYMWQKYTNTNVTGLPRSQFIYYLVFCKLVFLILGTWLSSDFSNLLVTIDLLIFAMFVFKPFLFESSFLLWGLWQTCSPGAQLYFLYSPQMYWKHFSTTSNKPFDLTFPLSHAGTSFTQEKSNLFPMRHILLDLLTLLHRWPWKPALHSRV